MKPAPRLMLFVAALAVPAVAAGQGPRYTAMLADGTRVTGNEVTPWQATSAQPRLGKTLLLNPENHVRWLRDNTLPLPVRPPAFVEYYGRDVLPGRVVGFRTGRESPYERLPPHLLVQPDPQLDFPGTHRPALRVATRWLRRIVWQRRPGDDYQPSTVFYRDGRTLRFRSLRFAPGAVRLLLADTTAQVAFEEIAELHLPPRDPWTCYFEQTALLSPDGSARLLRLQTAAGLRATASVERFQARQHGSHTPDYWYHMVQPAWSLDPLWVAHRAVQIRRYWLPHQVPLSDLQPAGEPPDWADSTRWPSRRDRNVRGGALRCAGEVFGWGVGMHAVERLSIPLPACVRRFHTRVGLDELAGRGGCARALVCCNDDLTAPLYKSPLLIGSAEVHAPEPIELRGPEGGQQTLTLVADDAHRERPAGADPLNIRDLVDWLEPELELDAARFREELLRHAPRLLPAWRAWTLDPPAGQAPVELVNRWDESLPGQETCRMELVPRVPLLTLSRQLQIDPGHRFLALCVSRFAENTTPARIQVRIAGEPAGTFDVPVRGGLDPDPILVPLEGYAGEEVQVELLPLPLGPRARLDWRATALVARPPGLLPILEDDEDFPQRLTDGTGEASLETEDVYAGERSLRIVPAERTAAELPGLPVAIRERPRLGEFRYLRFAWKKRGGTRVCLQLGHDGTLGPGPRQGNTARESYRYDAGRGGPSHGAARRLSGQLPEGWVVQTRDLYGDFGQFELTGISFSAPDGGYALFDHVYLGRTPQDFEKIEVKPRK